MLGRKLFLLVEFSTMDYSVAGGAVGSGTAQQTGRSPVRFPKGSLGF
jgi:hypothetical protein